MQAHIETTAMCSWPGALCVYTDGCHDCSRELQHYFTGKQEDESVVAMHVVWRRQAWLKPTWSPGGDAAHGLGGQRGDRSVVPRPDKEANEEALQLYRGSADSSGAPGGGGALAAPQIRQRREDHASCSSSCRACAPSYGEA